MTTSSGRVLLLGQEIARAPQLVPPRVSYLAQRPYGVQDITPWRSTGPALPRWEETSAGAGAAVALDLYVMQLTNYRWT